MTKFCEKIQNKSVLFFWQIWTTRGTFDWSKCFSLFRTMIFENKQPFYLKKNMIKTMPVFCHFFTRLFKAPSYLEKSYNAFLLSFLRQIALFVWFIVWS